MHVVFGRQGLVVGVVDEGVSEQLVHGPQERGLERTPSPGVRPLGHAAHVGGRETGRPGGGHLLGPDVVVVQQPGRPQDEKRTMTRRERGTLGQIGGEAQEAVGKSGNVEERPQRITRPPVRRVLRDDGLVDIGPLTFGERCEPRSRHWRRSRGSRGIGEGLHPAGLARRRDRHGGGSNTQSRRQHGAADAEDGHGVGRLTMPGAERQ